MATATKSRPVKGSVPEEFPFEVLPREDTILCEDLGHGQSEGGIHLPQAHVSDHRVARVVAVSPGWTHAAHHRPIENIEPGDWCIIKPNEARKVVVDDREYLYVSCLSVPLVIRKRKGARSRRAPMVT